MENLISITLENFLAERKKQNRHYSLRTMAKDLDISSGRLCNFMKGRDLPGPKLLSQIGQHLELSDDQISEITKSLDQIRYLKRGLGFSKQLTEEEFAQIGDWETWNVLTLLQHKLFDGSLQWLKNHIAISENTIITSLQKLIAVGIVEKSDEVYKLLYKNVTTSNDKPSMAIRRLHQQSIGLAVDSLDKVPVAKRDISMITQLIDPKNLPQAKKMIADFRAELNALLEDGNPTELYQLSVQLFPLGSEIKEGV